MLERLTETLQLDIKKIEHETLASPPQDYARFLKQVGMVKGLTLALQRVREVSQQLEEDLDRG